MQTTFNKTLYIIIVVLVIGLAVSLLWNRKVNAPTVSSTLPSIVNNGGTVSPSPSPAGGLPIPTKTPIKTPSPTTKPTATTGTKTTVQYYTPRGTQIILPTYYNSSNPADTLRVASPQQNTTVYSPINVTGEARGWYFEGTFSLVLTDAQNKILVTGSARAQNDWTSPDFVAYKASLAFPQQRSGSKGNLYFIKDNPSGLPQNDQYAVVQVTFQ